jgi:hypothetical protein
VAATQSEAPASALSAGDLHRHEAAPLAASPLTPTVFFFCRLGDMVMVTRMLNLLHRRYGRPCQVIGTGSWTATT